MAFGWEFVMTFFLVAVVYAVAIGKPNFVETGPLAVGFTLWASAFVGGSLLCCLWHLQASDPQVHFDKPILPEWRF